MGSFNEWRKAFVDAMADGDEGLAARIAEDALSAPWLDAGGGSGSGAGSGSLKGLTGVLAKMLEDPKEGLTEERVAEAVVAEKRERAKAELRERTTRPAPVFASGLAKTTFRLDPVLTISGMTGAVLARGRVAVLSGEGGVGKGALTADIAVACASAADGERAGACGGLFVVAGGSVVLAGWEESVELMGDRLRSVCRLRGEDEEACLARIHRAGMEGAPVFGPPNFEETSGGEDGPGSPKRMGHYNARPEPLPDWVLLWDLVARVKPALVVIDPIGAAYAGDPSNAASIRELVSALHLEAVRYDCAVLLVAHSTKSARDGGGSKKGASTPPAPNLKDEGATVGSGVWTDAARGVIRLVYAHCTEDEANGTNDQPLRRIVVLKSNLGPSYRTALIQPELAPRREGSDFGGEFGGVVAFNALEGADGKAWERIDDYTQRINEEVQRRNEEEAKRRAAEAKSGGKSDTGAAMTVDEPKPIVPPTMPVEQQAEQAIEFLFSGSTARPWQHATAEVLAEMLGWKAAAEKRTGKEVPKRWFLQQLRSREGFADVAELSAFVAEVEKEVGGE